MQKLFAPDSLGKPGEGFHFHFLGIAIMDLLATLGLSYVISRLTGWSFLLTAAGALAVGQVAHWYYRVPTRATCALGLVSEGCES